MIHLLQQGSTTHIYLSSGIEANHQDAIEISFANDPSMSETNFYGMGQLSNGVVLKVFRADAPNAHSKAMTEIDTLRRLQESSTISRCPFVIALYFVRESSSTPPSLPILGLEHCARGDLLTLCYDQDFIFEDVPFFAAELVLALDHLRKHNVLHGDIKPENIGVTGDGHIRLLDFKFAKVLGDQTTVVHEAGTLAYTSPEVLTRVPCTRAADWWSLGVVLFELLFHRPAFLENTEEETMNRIMLYGPKWPSSSELSTDDHASQILQGLFAHNPEQRICSAQSCQDLPFFSGVNWAQVAAQDWQPQTLALPLEILDYF